MADFLTAVSSRKTKDVDNPIQELQRLDVEDIAIDSPQAALEVLRNQPSRNVLSSVLRFLTNDGFSLMLPNPLNASIAHQLVNDTIPSFWRTLHETKESKVLARILCNPTGLGHIITRLRTLIADSQQNKVQNQARNTSEHIADIIQLVGQILWKDETSRIILIDILTHGKNDVQKKLVWREYLSQTASGRILSLIAEAEDVLKKADHGWESSWVGDGSKYATWLGRNVVNLLSSSSMNVDSGFNLSVIELCSKTLGLGYTNKFVEAVLTALIQNNQIQLIFNTVAKLKGFEQRKYFDAVLRYQVNSYFASNMVEKVDAPIAPSKSISGSAYLMHCMVKDNNVLKDYAVTCLTRSNNPLLDDSLPARRSLVAAIVTDEDKSHNLLEGCIKLFGESVYVKHTPVLQQEALAQTLALSSGYVQRTQPMFLTMMAKSSYHVNSMSNRIGAPSARARFLGIAVGTAISRLVDKPELQLKFELEGLEAEEAKWYQRLTEANDKIGTITDLQQLENSEMAVTIPKMKPKAIQKPTIASSATKINGPRIMEVLSDTEDEDADLMVYEKPDSDPEDDTDDPTAINRNKPTAPVYIRDLLAGLRDQENYDRHELALATAAPLIRRKANFGTEVTDHLEDLATILTGLHNNSELETFAQQRQQALIAVLLAKPAQMAQWFARSFFSGDYSLSQRIAMLTTLGLGARELAGMKDTSTDDMIPPQPAFPSKQLPPHLHALYSDAQTTPTVSKLSSRMAREMLSPLASQAADTLSGPSILQVRTFSSRMAVESRRSKPIPNALAQIVADNFFFPLTGRWWLQMRASSSKSDSIYSSTHLLPAFLQTLSILLNASGPNTLALPQMTREYWDLLLSVRGLAAGDKNVLGAVLFGFLMLLETNENKERVATEQGKEVLETQAWVKMVFDGLGAGSEEDERVRGLAAGVLVRCQEVVEKYQRRMAGDLMDY